MPGTPEVRVVGVHVEQDQICLEKLGQLHDCGDETQHTPGPRRILVEVATIGQNQTDFISLIGRVCRLVVVDLLDN